MSHGTYADQLESWGILVNNLESRLDSVPQAAAARDELRQLMDEVQKLSQEIVSASGELRKLTIRRRNLAYAARQKRLIIAAHLKAHYGFDHPGLIAFGIEPRTPKKRAKKAKVGGEGKG